MSSEDPSGPAADLATRRGQYASAMADAAPMLIAYVDPKGFYLYVNQAYETRFGRPRSQIEGHPVADLVGDAAYGRIKHYGDQALKGHAVGFKGKLAFDLATLSHIEARFIPDLSADGVAKGYHLLVAETPAGGDSEQELQRLLHQERRRTALLDLGRVLREEADPKVIAGRASLVLAQQLSAPRAGYAEVDAQGATAEIVGEWSAEGFPSLAGQVRELNAFSPQIGADLRAGKQIIMRDVNETALTPEISQAYARIRVSAFLTSPLIKLRRMTAYAYVCQDLPRTWTPDEIAFVGDVAELIWNASERARSEAALKRAEETERLLIREVDHRAKNVLAVVQSLAQLTPFENKAQYVEALSGRIGSLARSHSLLSTSRWTGVRLDALLREELEPYGAGADARVSLDGPPVLIDAQAAQSLGLVLHELATNASKYGGLSDIDGQLSVAWRWGEAGRLILTWRETASRPISAPVLKGFGSTLIDRASKQLGAELTKVWRDEGLVCQLKILHGATPCDTEPSPRTYGPGPTRQDHALKDQRVLIVEDEALVAMELAQVLSDAGAQIIGPAGSIEEALQLVARQTIDRAVLDINLGGRMVTPVAQALARRAIPFVYLTGYQDAGVSDGPVLRKPANADLLLSTLANRPAV